MIIVTISRVSFTFLLAFIATMHTRTTYCSTSIVSNLYSNEPRSSQAVLPTRQDEDSLLSAGNNSIIAYACVPCRAPIVARPQRVPNRSHFSSLARLKTLPTIHVQTHSQTRSRHTPRETGASLYCTTATTCKGGSSLKIHPMTIMLAL
jgi:hypothetical protein